MDKINLKDLQFDELKTLVTSMGEAGFRAGQIFSWLYKGAEDFAEMTNVPRPLREALAQRADMGVLVPERVQVSRKDGTRKYLFRLRDGNAVESVLMKYRYGNSVCISSQAGCRMGCKFCASTLEGLSRNLTAGEMSEQVLAAEREAGESVNHVVVMGTGEPFDNYDNLAQFISIINDGRGRGLGMRNITVSTCGLVPEIDRFAEDFPQVNLAISLHAADDGLRGSMMPVNGKYPLEALLAACRRYTETTSRRITFEYTLVGGVNDTDAHARLLAERLGGMLCHVNLITLNEVKETGLSSSAAERAEAFRAILEKKGVPATIRRKLGSDIDGACGQLRLGRSSPPGKR